MAKETKHTPRPDETVAHVELRKLAEIIRDFGSMGTGAFRAKYPDCGAYEGFGYIERAARIALAKAEPRP